MIDRLFFLDGDLCYLATSALFVCTNQVMINPLMRRTEEGEQRADVMNQN